MCAQWFTTFGLLLDIFGAVLVATEVVNKFNGAMIGPFPTIDSMDNPPPKTPEFIEWERKKFIKMTAGLICLILGFVLQMFGTWL